MTSRADRGTIRLTVPVSTLLANARKARQAIIDRQANATADYERDHETWLEELVTGIDALRTAPPDLPSLEPTWHTAYHDPGHLTVKVPHVRRRPDEPSPAQTAAVDKHIGLLEATTDTSIVLTSEDDLGAYL
jgi:hypothetical protein